MEKQRNRVQAGWEGRYYEDFKVGDIYRSRFGRTITDVDNHLFTHLTMNTNPLHFDIEYAKQTPWNRILVNSTFTLALVVGTTVTDVSENAKANLGWEEVRLPNPVFIGDTLYSETEVLSKRESKSNPDAGIVTVRSQGINHKGKIVIDFVRSVLIYKRNHAPARRFPEVTK